MSFPEVGRWLRKRQGRLVSDDEHIRGLGRISEFEQVLKLPCCLMLGPLHPLEASIGLSILSLKGRSKCTGH